MTTEEADKQYNEAKADLDNYIKNDLMADVLKWVNSDDFDPELLKELTKNETEALEFDDVEDAYDYYCNSVNALDPDGDQEEHVEGFENWVNNGRANGQITLVGE